MARAIAHALLSILVAMIDRVDREIGRVLEQVRTLGAWDNTVKTVFGRPAD